MYLMQNLTSPINCKICFSLAKRCGVKLPALLHFFKTHDEKYIQIKTLGNIFNDDYIPDSGFV